MSHWKIIVPEATRNMVLNPSIEATGNIAGIGGIGVAPARSTANSFWGDYSCLVRLDADNEGVSFTLNSLSNAVHYVTMWAFAEIAFDTIDWDWSLDNTNYHRPSALLGYSYGDETTKHVLFGYSFPANEANGSTLLYVRQNGTGGIKNWYLDGIQVEQKISYWTSYCDGDQDGCSWDGTPHASTSRRFEIARSGGRVYDLEDDYSFNIEAMQGVGSARHSLATEPYALLPGSELSNDKLESRDFTLIGTIQGTSWDNYHALRGALLAVLTTESTPYSTRGPQPIRFYYTGVDATTMYLDAYYRGGLELRLSARRDPCWFERNIGLRFLAPDPLWYELGEESNSLSTSTAPTLRCISGRMYSTADWGLDAGKWDDLSVSAITAGAGGGTEIRTIVQGSDNKVYVGGNFTNLDGIAACDHIACYDPLADTWAALGGGLNHRVRALAFGPDGTLYAGGDFTDGDQAATDADADYLAQWSGSAWSAVGGAGTRNGAVAAILIDADGKLIIGGEFTDWMTDTDADYIAIWDGSTWSHLDADELNNHVYCLALAPNDDLFIGGAFTQKVGPVTLNYVCRWDGTDFVPLGTTASNGVNNLVFALAVDRSGQLYLGGDFTTAMGDTINRIALWNGTMFEALGNGIDARVRTLTFGPDDTLWVGGAFSSMDDLGWVDRVARWKDSSWAAADIDLPGTATVYAIGIGAENPVLSQNYDLYVGWDTSGAAAVQGANVLSLTGTWRKYPLFTIERSGGTSARLISLKHVQSGDELLFDYPLQNGEKITIDLNQSMKSISSSFFGHIPAALLPNSDFGTFRYMSETVGNSLVLAFVAVAGAPTITAFSRHLIAHESLD